MMLDACRGPAAPPLAFPGRIESLRFVGTGHAVPLSTGQATFTIGATGCDVIVPAAIAAGALRAATLTRWPDAAALSVREHGAVEQRVVQSGGVFWLGEVPVLAMDPRLEDLRAALSCCLGLDRHDAVDAAVEVLAEGRPIALLGPDGLDATRLAAAIHRASPYRDGPLRSVTAAPLPKLPDGHGGSLVIDLRSVQKLTAPFARELFDRRRGPRPILVARNERQLRSRIDTYGDRVRTLALVPLAQRPGDVVRLLAMIWREVHDSDLDVAELGPSVRDLGRYRWPRNLDELREHAARLLAYVEHGGIRGAARVLGVTHQTLCGHFRRIGLVVPDQGER